MKKFYFTFFICVCVHVVNGQTYSNVIKNSIGSLYEIGNSPNVSSYRIFGDFAPSNFIGVADISIPIHTINHRDNAYPIVLRYHNGMGNKVDAISGSNGLGWNLSSGGVISLVESRKLTMSNDDEDLIDYSKNHVVNVDNWSTLGYLSNFIVNPRRPLSARSVVNNYFKSLQKNVFTFNFNGVSGEIYIDHNEKPKIRSKDNVYFDIEFEFVPYSIEDTESNPAKTFGFWIKLPSLKRYFNRAAIAKTVPSINLIQDPINQGSVMLSEDSVYKITLTDYNGVKYIFGGNRNSIELSRLGHSGVLESIDPANYEITPISWHLTEILYPNHEKIIYDYRRGDVLYTGKTVTNLRENMFTNTKNNDVRDNFMRQEIVANTVTGTLINPVYLTSITTPTERLEFSYSKSKQLEHHLKDFVGFGECNPTVGDPNCVYTKNPSLDIKNNFFFWYTNDVNYTDFTLFEQLPDQLDQIKILNSSNQVFKEIQFNYTQNYSERLKLLSLKINDSLDENSRNEKYSFSYNDVKLPSYDSYKVDHNGFYNNKFGIGYSSSSLEGETKRPLLNEFKNSSDKRNEYTALRESSENYSNAELLTQITYPTGGFTVFNYEPNMYGAVANNYPFVVSNNVNNISKITGGVRLKQVVSFDDAGEITKFKSFKYVKAHEVGGNQSSGILTHIPTYFDFIKGNNFYESQEEESTNVDAIDYFNWSTSDIYPAHRLRGNHITYSEVTEIDELEKSFVVYKYKNFDNGYHDKGVLNHISNHEEVLKDEFGNTKEFWKKYDVISMDLERGQLLSKTSFNNNKKKINEILYEYDDNPNRFNSHIREINRYGNKIYSPYTKDMTSWTYIASLIYTYTPYLTKKTVIDNVGANSIINSESSYAYNDKYKVLTEKTEKRGAKTFKTTYKYPFDFTESVYTGMVSKNIVAPVILEESFINDTKVSATKINYKLNTTIITDPVPYTNNEAISDDASNTSFLAGNNPDIIGTNYVPKDIEVQYKNGIWEKQVEFFEYDNRLNLLSSKDITGKTTNYLWSYKKTLPIWTIENVSYGTIIGVTGKNAINNLANDAEPSQEKMNVLEQEINANNELKAAFKTRYLYDPVLGLTYKETPLGTKEYYKYDGFGRLIKVEDGDKNTLIEYEYNYKQN